MGPAWAMMAVPGTALATTSATVSLPDPAPPAMRMMGEEWLISGLYRPGLETQERRLDVVQDVELGLGVGRKQYRGPRQYNRPRLRGRRYSDRAAPRRAAL